MMTGMFSPSLQTVWEVKAAEMVDTLLENFIGIRDLELGESVHAYCLLHTSHLCKPNP